MATIVATGGCLCGSVRYAVSSLPIRTTICHCRFCQRATGAAYHIAPVFLREHFAVTEGKPRQYRHDSEGSGMFIDVHFCTNCGTKIFLELERFPETLGVYGGTFDDPNCWHDTSKVTRQIFLESGRHSTIVMPGVESFLGHAINADGAPLSSFELDTPIELGKLLKNSGNFDTD